MDLLTAACAAVAVTVAASLDHAASLVGSSLHAGRKRRRAVLASSAVSMALLIAAVVIAFTTTSIPIEAVGLLGIVPVVVSVRAIRQGSARRQTPISGWISAVLATLATGGVEVACWIVVLRWSASGARDGTVGAIACTVVIETALACVLAPRRAAAPTARALRAVAPYALIATGIALVVVTEWVRR